MIFEVVKEFLKNAFSLSKEKGYFDITSSALLFCLTLLSEWEHGNHQILVFKCSFLQLLPRCWVLQVASVLLKSLFCVVFVCLFLLLDSHCWASQ